MSSWVFVREGGLVEGEEVVKTERREEWEEIRPRVSWGLLEPGMERKDEVDGGSGGGGEPRFTGGGLEIAETWGGGEEKGA